MGVTLLITTGDFNLPNIETRSSIAGINWGTVDNLVFHSAKETEVSVSLELTRLKGSVEKVIYINEDIIPLYYCLFMGLNADIYDAEEYLHDKELITFLLDNYKETNMTAKPPSSDVEVLAKGIATISTGNPDNIKKLVENKYWIKTLNKAVSNVDNALIRSSQINIDIIDMLEEAAKLVDETKKSQVRASNELDNLQKMISDLEQKTRGNSSLFAFSTYKVDVKVPKVLQIKEVGHCRYLNSFIVAYQDYLKMHKQITSKVLIVLPKLETHLERYKEIPRLAPDSIDIINLATSNIYVTFEPSKSVLDVFFDQQGVSLYLVVDLMFGRTLLKGNMVENLYGVSSINDPKRFKLPVPKCIFPITALKEGILIPHINDYVRASTDHQRRALYFRESRVAFTKIDTLLFRERGDKPC